MNNTTETKMENLEMFPRFAVEIGATVECFKSKETGIVLEIYEANIAGRIPVRVVNSVTGADMMPYMDECRVTKPYVSKGFKHEISQETAERFADYARRK